MPEEDWYRLSPRTRNYAEAALAIAGGAFWTVASLVGYDLGRRSYGPGIPVVSRWIGRVEPVQLVIGVVLLAYGLWTFRRAQRTR